MVNKLNRPQGNGKLVFINSLFPTNDPTTGGPVVHREQADAFSAAGYDVVLIEGNNKLNEMSGTAPFRIRSILFDGRDPRTNPEYLNEPHRYDAISPTVPFNLPVFLGAPTSSNLIVGLTDAQIGQYVMSWAWAIRSAMLVYGVPNVSWNGHEWFLNALTASVPTIFTGHGTAVSYEGGWSETRLRPLNQIGVNRAFLDGAISEQEFENITDPARYGMDPKKVQVIRNGYNTDIFRPDIQVTKADLIRRHGEKLKAIDPTVPWVVFAGRAAHFKGIDNLIRAMQRVHDKTGAHLIIVGSGDYKKVKAPNGEPVNLPAMVDRLSLTGRVHFVGAMPQPEMARFIKAADAYVLPSRKEPFGLVAIEGMGVGKVPILTANGGFLDIVGERTDVARLVKPEDPDSLEVLQMARDHIARNTDLPDAVRAGAMELLNLQMHNAGEHFTACDGAVYDEQTLARINRERDQAVTLYARDIAISSLAEGILAELELAPEERQARGAVAEQHAHANYSMKEVALEEMVPWLEKATQKGTRVDFELNYTSGRHRPKRQERLDAIQMDPDVAQAYRHLQQSIGHEQFGHAWRAFDNTVAHYFGRSELPHPYNIEALPNFADSPNAIFSEVARASGVSTQEMFETMHQVELTPVESLERLSAPNLFGATLFGRVFGR